MAVELVFAILTNNLGYYLSAFSIFVTSIALFLTIKKQNKYKKDMTEEEELKG
jgi:hypothetical protein